MAKIDIGLNFLGDSDEAAGLNNFLLEEIYLYNANDKLQISPTAGTLDVSGTAAKVKAPSVPDDAEVFGEPEVSGGEITPISYARRTYNPNGYKSFMSEIYLAEHETIIMC
ncbi:MAG: hypothetical protein LBB62_03270 [Proteiniphilum sp.]|nr:hypothetical protein [Proteiniphilum sp.]